MSFSRAQPEKDYREDNQDGSPDEVDIDSERSLVNRFIADQSESSQQHAENREHQTDRQPYIESHHAPSIKNNIQQDGYAEDETRQRCRLYIPCEGFVFGTIGQ